VEPSWSDLRFLEALARTGSARAAGRDLGVAPSTIYRRIAALEQTVGFPCLDRGQGVTPAGRELAALARATSDSLDEIARRARERRTEVRGTVTLTTIDGFAPLLAAPLAEMSAVYPSLRVDVQVLEGGGPSLSRRQAEVGITLIQAPPAALVRRRLFAVEWAIYGARSVAADPASARWVVLARPHDKSWLGAWEAKHVPAARIAGATASRRLLVDLVAAGMGLGLLPRRLAKDHPGLVEVTMHKTSVAALTRPAWLVFHPELRRDARVVALVDKLAAHLTG